MFDCNFYGFFSKLMLRRGNSAKPDAPDRCNIACPPGHGLESSDNGIKISTSQNQTIHVQHNPIAPPAKHNLIHGLPPEIMRIIFLSALERSKVRNVELKRVIRTGQVCRRWRDILNSMKCFWNDIQIRREDPWPWPNVCPILLLASPFRFYRHLVQIPGSTYPPPQFLELILKRARGSSIKLEIFIDICEYTWLFRMLQDVLSDITYLTLSPRHPMDSFADLHPILCQLHLPSLAVLKVSTSPESDVGAAYMFAECLLGIATRSKVPLLSLAISCRVESLVGVLNQSQIFPRVKSLTLEIGKNFQYLLRYIVLRNPTVGTDSSSPKPLSRTVHFSSLYYLRTDSIELLFEHLSLPKLRALNIVYGRGEHAHQLESLGSIAPQIQKLVLRQNTLPYTVTRGCAVPFTNLLELVVQRIPSKDSSSHLLLAPNLKILQIRDRQRMSPVHCLGYMLSPDGMLGPIHALTRLRMQKITLSNPSQTEYCTYHLHFHPHLESLTFIDCNLPNDFLEYMLRPPSTTEELLPNLKELIFEDCREPSREWIAELAILRPQLDCFKRGQ
jgi:hypothetical protein